MNGATCVRLQLRSSDRQALVSESSRPSTALIGICILLFFSVLSFGAVEEWSISILEFGLGLLFLAWTASQTSASRLQIKSCPLYAPVALFAVVVVIQLGFGLTAYRFATWISAVEYLSYAILIFITVEILSDSSSAESLVWAFTLFGFALALFAVIQDLTSNGKIYWLRTLHNGGAIFGPYVNRDHYAGLMEMLAPIPIVLSMSSLISGGKRGVVALAGVVMAGSIVLSQSRAGTAAFLGEMVLLQAVLLGRRKNGRITATLVGFCLMVLAFVAWVGTSALWHRFSELQDWMRLTILKDGLQMFWHKPILGWGLGTFTTVYPQFRSFYTNLFVNAAHNDYVQVLVETGLIGFAAVVWFIVQVYRAGLGNADGWNHNWSRALGLSALIGCSGLLIHSAFDFNLQIPANACMFYFFCAVTTETASLPEGRERKGRPRTEFRGTILQPDFGKNRLTDKQLPSCIELHEKSSFRTGENKCR
jgi:O-antigen ligase